MKIRYFAENTHDAVSWYRVAGPLQKLKYLDPSIEVEHTKDVDWHHLMDADIVFISNPYQPSHAMAMYAAHELGIPVWVDYDDDVLNIPVDHPRYKAFSDFAIKETIWHCMEKAQVVTVPTPALAETVKNYTNHVFVIENAFNDYNQILPAHANNTDIIAWRGGVTHWEDLDTLADEIKLLGTRHPEWSWEFIGRRIDVKHIIKGMTNANVHDWTQNDLMPLLTYFQKLKKIAPAVFIHPLIDNQFNRAKSNIAFIEGTLAGAMCLMPELPELLLTGAQLYQSGKDFTSTLEAAMKNDEYREKVFQLQREHILTCLKLSEINKKRVVVARLLTGGPA